MNESAMDSSTRQPFLWAGWGLGTLVRAEPLGVASRTVGTSMGCRPGRGVFAHRPGRSLGHRTPVRVATPNSTSASARSSSAGPRTSASQRPNAPSPMPTVP
jgi:hypothetical protein